MIWEPDYPTMLSWKKKKIRTKSPYGLDFPGGAVDKNPPANAGDMGPIPSPGRFHMLRGS